MDANYHAAIVMLSKLIIEHITSLAQNLETPMTGDVCGIEAGKVGDDYES